MKRYTVKNAEGETILTTTSKDLVKSTIEAQKGKKLTVKEEEYTSETTKNIGGAIFTILLVLLGIYLIGLILNFIYMSITR